MKIIIVSQNSIRNGLLRVNDFELWNEIGEFTVYKSSTTPDLVIFSKGLTESFQKDLITLFECYKPLFVVSLGFASSVNQDVKIGSILKFDDISAVSGPMALWNSDEIQKLVAPVNRPLSALFETLDENRGWFYKGSLLTTPKLVSNITMKHWLSEEFQVFAIDEDGFYIAQLCRDQKLPYSVIRGINNDMKTNSAKLIDLMSRKRPIGLWRSIIRPNHYLSYVKLYSRNLKAHKNLERLLDRVLGLELC